MRRIVARLEKSGFLIFWVSLLVLAAGVAQGWAIVRDVAAIVLIVIGLVLFMRARRGVRGRPKAR